MNAMILAAGLGTRLSPLTKHTPKALLQIKGKPLLYIVLDRCIKMGFHRIAVNTHHYSDKIRRAVSEYSFPAKTFLYISEEPTLLDTGGGIKKMVPLLGTSEPILVINVDILANINLKQIVQFHHQQGADATLVVRDETTQRPLAFDQRMRFKGRYFASTPQVKPYQFCGIQVIAPWIFRDYPGDAFYSIDAYIRALKYDGIINGYLDTDSYWRDIGTFEDYERAQIDVIDGKIEI